MKHFLISVCILFFVTGCSSTNGTGFLNWVFGRKAAEVKKEEKKEDAKEDSSVTAAHIEIVKTQTALQIAKSKNPESREIEIPLRTNGNALNLLNIRKPLNLEDYNKAVNTANGLLSEDGKAREKAETAQKAAESKNEKLSKDLDEIRQHLATVRKAELEESAKNLELANELRWQRIQAWGATGLSLVLGLAAVAYRLNIGRMQAGMADLLSNVERDHGEGAAKTARTALDAALTVGEQQAVAKKLLEILVAKK